MKGISYYSAQSGHSDYYKRKMKDGCELAELWAQLVGIGIVVLAVWLAGCGLVELIRRVAG